jgi:delta1-piperideine-2-carboxylate reductase
MNEAAMNEEVRLSLDEVRALALQCLVINGCDEENAGAIAANMTLAERDICSSHGLFRLPWHAHSLKSGKANGQARPRLEHLAPGVIKVHGDRGFAPLGHAVGRQPLIEAARLNGIAAMAYVDMYHIAALWPETEALALEGLIAFAFTASLPYVAAPGGTKPIFGTNPMAFAWPRKDRPPVVFDQASAAMARGEIMIAGRDGRELPPGVGIDSEGRPTRDPKAVLEGAQLPFGGYKGASLALMIELLAGPLIGDFLSIEAEEDDAGAGAAPHGGELILALDPRRFGDPEFCLDHAEKLFAAITAEGRSRLPGDRRVENRTKTAIEGVTIPRSLYDSIKALMKS